MDERRKQQMGIAFFIAALLIFLMSFFYKNAQGETRVATLNNKNNQIQKLNTDVISNEELLKSLDNEYQMKKDQLKTTKIEAEQSKKYVNSIDLDLHLPSFLVDIDQKAKELDLNLIIDLNQRKLIEEEEEVKNKQETDEDNEAENKTKKEMDQESKEYQEDLTEKIKENSDIDKKLEKDSSEIDENKNTENKEEKTQNNSNQIQYKHDGVLQSIDQISIPLKIDGSYNNVRSFLHYIDTLNAIDSRYINLQSDGSNISGDIIIHIFYKGVRK